jgi:uncharacterized protein
VILFSRTMRALRRRSLPTSPSDREIRRGTCAPGSERLFVTCAGDLYPCEKTDGRRHLRLGHVDDGVDLTRARSILEDFHAFLADDCANCWLWRLCQVCPAGPSIGHGFDRDRARAVCDGHREGMAHMLSLYASILERNPTALDFFLEETPVPQPAAPVG